MKRAGWTRLSPPGEKLVARWRHDDSGWEVRHCGHPTANWPYHAVDPDDPAPCIVGTSGRGWRRLADALPEVELLVVGELVLGEEWLAGQILARRMEVAS